MHACVLVSTYERVSTHVYMHVNGYARMHIQSHLNCVIGVRPSLAVTNLNTCSSSSICSSLYNNKHTHVLAYVRTSHVVFREEALVPFKDFKIQTTRILYTHLSAYLVINFFLIIKLCTTTCGMTHS